MTFKELLDCVQFEDVAPHIVKMYPDIGQSLGWYKIHFDMLRLMQPVFHDCILMLIRWRVTCGNTH